jgi:hypothetical protein
VTDLAAALAPLVAQAVREQLPGLVAQALAERDRLARAATTGPRTLSLAAVAKRYGVGRIEAKRLISNGKLPSVERRCRGGRMGTFIAVEDCERVLAGRRTAPKTSTAL